MIFMAAFLEHGCVKDKSNLVLLETLCFCENINLLMLHSPPPPTLLSVCCYLSYMLKLTWNNKEITGKNAHWNCFNKFAHKNFIKSNSLNSHLYFWTSKIFILDPLLKKSNEKKKRTRRTFCSVKFSNENIFFPAYYLKWKCTCPYELVVTNLWKKIVGEGQYFIKITKNQGLNENFSAYLLIIYFYNE